MRYVKLVLVPEGEGGFNPAEGALAAEPRVSREAIHHVNLLNDGTAVALSSFRGEAAVLQAVLSDSEKVLRYDVSEADDGLQAYVHFRPTDIAAALLRLTREYELVVDTPIEFGENGALRVAVIGEHDTVRRAIEHVPEDVRIELEGLSEYTPESRAFSALLTERQREILRTAVAVGYYEVPRNATHQDIADELDLSTTTVGEHLRKIEARLLSELVD